MPKDKNKANDTAAKAAAVPAEQAAHVVTREITDSQKAAAVIVSLGTERASNIYKYMDESDVEKLTVAVARLGHLKAEETEAVLDEFYKTAMTQKVVTDGGIDYARAVLEKAFGKSTATNLLDKVTKSLKTRPFDFMKKADVKTLFAMLQHERSQTIALILSYVDSDTVAKIIEQFDEQKKLEVVESVARMESASPDAVKLVEEEMKRKFSNVLTTDFTTVGGIDFIADVMNHIDRNDEKAIFEGLSERDADLADDIRKKMFVFEDIAGMDDRSIQRFIRDCDSKDVVYALKASSDTIKNLIFKNMSKRMAEGIRSDLEITSNVRLKDAQEAQQRIVNIIRRLEEQGELIITKGGGDDVIV